MAATVVPSAPLRRPREQAAAVLAKVAELLRAAAEVMVDGDAERGLDLLDDARATDHLVRRLQAAADEGMAVVASSPFRVRHRPGIRRMADIVDPLDRALRSTRVLVRQVARRGLPPPRRSRTPTPCWPTTSPTRSTGWSPSCAPTGRPTTCAPALLAVGRRDRASSSAPRR